MPATPARDSDLTVIRHAPERGQNAAPEILPAGCCCCCCCLHTLGGIAGAAVGSAVPMARQPVYESDPDSPFPYRRDVFEEDQPLVSPVLVYWLLVTLAVGVTIGVTAFMNGSGPGMQDPFELVAMGFFVAVMLLPGLQLIASLFAVALVAIFYPERGYALRRLARITLYCFAGALLGVLLMAGCFGAIVMSEKIR